MYTAEAVTHAVNPSGGHEAFDDSFFLSHSGIVVDTEPTLHPMGGPRGDHATSPTATPSSLGTNPLPVSANRRVHGRSGDSRYLPIMRRPGS